MEAIKRKTPLLRFPEFDGEWEQKRYDNIFSFYTTNSLSRENLNYEFGAVRNIHYGDIHTKFQTIFKLENEIVPFINEVVNLNRISQDCYIKEGDIVIADASEDYSDIGKSIEIKSLNGENVLAGLHTLLSRPKKNHFAIGFAGYLMKTWNVRYQIMTIAQGIKVLSISTTRLKEINLHLPTLPEQTKIANLLTAVDDKIQQLTRKKVLLEQYKKSLLKQIFNREIRFKDDDGNEFPEWEINKFGDIFTFWNTNSFSREKLNYESGEIKNIHYGDIHKKFKSHFDVTLEKVPFINNDVRISQIKNQHYCKKGDILFADASEDYNDIGKCLEIINTNDEKILAGLHILHARPTSNNLYGGFGGFLMQSFQVKKQIKIIAHGIKVLSISATRLGEINLEMPCLNEQQKIANFLTAIDQKIEAVNIQITNMQSWKKGLLQQLFV